jgi:cyclic dehypoxanthinyl futalosine synthase
MSLDRAASGARLTADEALALHGLPLFDWRRRPRGAARAHRPGRRHLPDRPQRQLLQRLQRRLQLLRLLPDPSQDDAYVLSFEQISAKLRELEAVGGTRVLMQGGVNPYLPFSGTSTCCGTCGRHPTIRIEAFSPEEIKGMAKLTGMTTPRCCASSRRRPRRPAGGGGEMLVDEVRHAKHVSPARISTDEWLPSWPRPRRWASTPPPRW